MNATPPRSTFVTVIGWIFLVLSCFALLMVLLQGFIMQVAFSGSEFREALQTASSQRPGVPPLSLFALRHMTWFLLVPAVALILSFVASLGLLRRWAWARLLFIALMIIGIIWNLAGLVLQFFMMPSMQQAFAHLPPEAPDLQTFMSVIMIVGALFAIGYCVLFGWIAKRLMAPAIKAEFKA